MKIKRYSNSDGCFLLMKIKIPFEWVDQLELLVQISGLRKIEEYVKTLFAWKLITEKRAIEKQRQTNIEEQKRSDEYWRLMDESDREEQKYHGYRDKF